MPIKLLTRLTNGDPVVITEDMWLIILSENISRKHYANDHIYRQWEHGT